MFLLGDFLHDYGLVVEFEGSADKGKTASMVAVALDLVNYLGYEGKEVHGNLWVDIEGYHQYDNAGLRHFIREMFAKDMRHLIILADEIDSIYPSRGFKEKLQTDEVLKLNQMTKTENWFLFTRHLGSAIDKIIRDCTNISVDTLYEVTEDKIYCEIINAVDCDNELVYREVDPASDVFSKYKRWIPSK